MKTDMTLIEPDATKPRLKDDIELTAYHDMLDEVTAMAHKTDDPYWQGKKDGMRIALLLLRPLSQEARSVASLQLTANSEWVQTIESEKELLDGYLK